MSYHLGLDVGATNLRCVVATDGLERLAAVTEPTPQGPTAAAFTDGVSRAIEAALDDAGIAPDRIASVGLASFGPLDVEAGRIVETLNLDGDIGPIPIETAVADRFPAGTPVVLLNDAVAGAVAEHRGGEAGPREENVVYVTISSGIGAGAVVDGTLLSGRGGNAAEVGHFTLAPASDRRCGCGGTGHWEAFASGENLPAYACELQEREGFETALPTDPDALAAATLFARDGEDPLATATLDRLERWNTLGTACVVHAFAPDRIAIGGAVALNNRGRVIDPIRERIDAHLAVEAPEIHATTFGADVEVTGALLRAIEAADA